MEKSTSSAVAAFGTESHQLKLGRSFDRDKHRAFHTIRYDFKPASVDHSKEALLEVGEGHEVNVTLPNVESKGTTCTRFKGSKRPLQKECVLIYDHGTGEFTLERLTCNMQVKKQREETKPRPLSGLDSNNPKNSPSLTSSTSRNKKGDLSSAVLTAPETEQGGEISPLQPSPLAPSPHAPSPHLHASPHHDDSDSDSSSYITDSDSDEDEKRSSGSSSSEDESESASSQRNGGPNSRHPSHRNWRTAPTKPENPPRSKQHGSSHDALYLRSQLSQDLQLSDDSDSD